MKPSTSIGWLRTAVSSPGSSRTSWHVIPMTAR
jgi:hypothetical protein